jgi:hypothetical protein
MREDDSDILEYSIIKYQPASFLGLNGYEYFEWASLGESDTTHGGP